MNAEAQPSWQELRNLETQLASAREALEGLRERASRDLASAHSDLVAKNRRITTLEAELAKVKDEDDGTAESRDARELLTLWREWVKGGNSRVNLRHPSRREAMLKALKLYGRRRCEDAIRGMRYDDWAMGRSARSKKPYNDVKHLIADAERFEHFEGLWRQHNPVHEPHDDKPKDVAVGQGWLEQARFTIRGADVGRNGMPSKELRARAGGDYELQEGSSLTPLHKVLDRLRDAGCSVRDHGALHDSWSCQCPSHEDREPSLSVRRSTSGMVLVHCFRGCETVDVLTALNLTYRDLFHGAHRDRAAHVPAPPRPTSWARNAARELYELLAGSADDDDDAGDGDAPQ